MYSTIEFWPMLVASVISFAIGALWYSPVLFGKQWMELNKIDSSNMSADKKKGMWKLYVAQFVCTLIMFYVLSFIIAAADMIGWSSGALTGFLVWVGFVATNALSSFIWERKPMKLVLISSVSILINLVIGGAIIGAWK